MKLNKNSASHIFCWSVWLACLAWMLVMIGRQGSRWPWSDEWCFVPYLTGAQSVTWQWFWAQHVDHRIPAIKLIYFILYKIWPMDFRAPIFFSAGMMAIISAVLLLITRKLRGSSSYVDAFLPLFMMHMGLGVIDWGFKIQFVLSTFFMCGILAVWSNMIAEGRCRLNLWESFCLPCLMIILSLCGTNGVILSAGCIVFLSLFHLCRSGNSSLDRISRRVFIFGTVTAAVLNVLYFLNFSREDHHWSPLTAAAFLKGFFYLGVAPLKILEVIPWWRVGYLIFFFGGCLLFLVYRLNRKTDSENNRFAVFSFISLLLIQCVLAMGIAYGRAAQGWNSGLSRHYAVLMAPLYIGIFFFAIKAQIKFLLQGMFVLAFVIYAVCLPGSLSETHRVRLKFKKVDDSLSTSSDVDRFIKKNTASLFYIDTAGAQELVREGMLSFAQQKAKGRGGFMDRF